MKKAPRLVRVHLLIAVALAMALGAPPVAAAQTAATGQTGRPEHGISTQQWDRLRQAFYQEKVASLAGVKPSAPTPESAVLPDPSPGNPQTVTWRGTLTYLPETLGGVPLAGGDPCGETECQEFRLTVPDSAKSLYLKVTWERSDFGLYLYAIDPASNQHGLDFLDLDNRYDKRPGNSTTLPMSETSIADPPPGEWKIRVRAAWGLDVAYAALATVTSEPLIEYPREDPVQLSRWAVHRIPVNVVLAGFEVTAEQLAELKSLLPTQYRTAVLLWEIADGGPPSKSGEPNSCGGGNWRRCFYHGTYSEQERERDGDVPFFEPVLIEYDYHFIQADEAYTRAAFAAMRDLTEKGARAQTTAGGSDTTYLVRYGQQGGGRFRTPQVSANTPVDLIDAIGFEDWIFSTRFEFCDNFRDLETGKIHGGGFITPQVDAYYDPYYDRFGKNLDRMPQGRGDGLTIFFFDTYSTAYAKEYFDVSRFHNFTVEEAFRDPDTGQTAVQIPNPESTFFPRFIDFARVWGGRYRFAFFDLGAAPNPFEFNSLGGGSADFSIGDPPIWEYRNDSRWQPRFVRQGLARNITTMVFARMTASFLYRPIPRDIYQLTTTNFVDYYSKPPYGTLQTDLGKLYNEALAARWLSSAIPAATFRGAGEIPGFVGDRILNCSDVHVGSKNPETKTVVMLPDPTCLGRAPDLLQKTVELAKAQGDDIFALGIPFEQAVSASVVRNFWEENRPTYAPVGAGRYSLIVINAVFEKAYTWALPVVVLGIAYPTSHNESWGIFQNVNEVLLPGGLVNGFTYTVEHEASHSLGLLHPHDIIGVDKDEAGGWNYYYESTTWMPDTTQSPTTYFGTIFPYGVWDQDNLMRGHAGEYIRMTQDAVADAYFEAARRGIASIEGAPDVLARQELTTSYLEKGRTLFAAGDYLHAEYAFRNAFLAASGHTGPEVGPRPLSPGERVFFKANAQGGGSRDQSLAVCGTTMERLSETGERRQPLFSLTGLVLILAATLLVAQLKARGQRPISDATRSR